VIAQPVALRPGRSAIIRLEKVGRVRWGSVGYKRPLRNGSHHSLARPRSHASPRTRRLRRIAHIHPPTQRESVCVCARARRFDGVRYRLASRGLSRRRPRDHRASDIAWRRCQCTLRTRGGVGPRTRLYSCTISRRRPVRYNEFNGRLRSASGACWRVVGSCVVRVAAASQGSAPRRAPSARVDPRLLPWISRYVPLQASL